VAKFVILQNLLNSEIKLLLSDGFHMAAILGFRKLSDDEP